MTGNVSKKGRPKASPMTRALALSVTVIGALGAILGVETGAMAEQSYPWCINKPDTPPQCRYATLEQCLADRIGKGGSCSPSPYPSSAASPQSRKLPAR